MARVILTCFEPFDGQTINASQVVARAVAAEFAGAPDYGDDDGGEPAVIDVLSLPVVRFDAITLAVNHVEQTRPDVIIMLGEDGKRDVISLERVATNLDDFRIPDNGGFQPRGEIIYEGAPAYYLSTLPLQAILAAIQMVHVPAAVSDSAGGFLCNHLFFGVRHALELAKRNIRAGFIHIPRFAEQVADSTSRRSGADEGVTGLPQELSIQAVRLIILATLVSKFGALKRADIQ